MNTTDRLAKIEARAAAAAPGPWMVNPMGELRAPSPYNGLLMAHAWASGVDGPDADFIAHSRDDISFLLALLRQRDARIAAIAAELNGLMDSLDDHVTHDDIYGALHALWTSLTTPQEGSPR